MKHRLIAIAAAGSLALWLATAFMWVRSYRVMDNLIYLHRDANRNEKQYGILSLRGGMCLWRRHASFPPHLEGKLLEEWEKHERAKPPGFDYVYWSPAELDKYEPNGRRASYFSVPDGPHPLGFEWAFLSQPSSRYSGCTISALSLSMPYWFLSLLTGVLPLGWVGLRWCHKRRFRL